MKDQRLRYPAIGDVDAANLASLFAIYDNFEFNWILSQKVNHVRISTVFYHDKLCNVTGVLPEETIEGLLKKIESPAASEYKANAGHGFLDLVLDMSRRTTWNPLPTNLFRRRHYGFDASAHAFGI
jgi:hypothetical protein